MGTREKIGQMTQPDQASLRNVTDIEKYFLGSLLSGGSSDPKAGNSLEAWTDMVDGCIQHSLKTRLAIPLPCGVDAKLVEKIGRITAEEVRATGIQWAFAPCVTVPQDIRWARESAESAGLREALRRRFRGRGLDQGTPHRRQ